jgi:3-isopropylmalate/(R)-2-methylmalate dehydratase small subunit
LLKLPANIESGIIMEAFKPIQSVYIPLPQRNVDTDQIIPARYLKVTDKAGLAEGLFSGWRYLPDGSPNPEFPLNQPAYQGAQVIVAGDNFGSGSSREHAPWALTGWGIRAVISTSFADIFYSNAMKNGLLPVVVDEQTQSALFDFARQDPSASVRVDLAEQRLTLPDGSWVTFPVDAFNKTCLLEGVDQLGYILKHSVAIDRYEQQAANRFVSTARQAG